MGCVALYIYIVLITLVARREKMSDGLDKLIKHHSLHWSPFSWNDTSIFGFVEPELDRFGLYKGKFFTWVQLGVDHQYRSTWVLLTHRLVTTFTRLYLGIRYLSLLYQWWMNKFWWCKIYIYIPLEKNFKNEKGKCEEAGWNGCTVQETYIYVTNTLMWKGFIFMDWKMDAQVLMRYITLE